LSKLEELKPWNTELEESVHGTLAYSALGAGRASEEGEVYSEGSTSG
jgi:hypothetical protein